MKKTPNLYFIVTTMDGVPVLNKDGSIMQYTSTNSMREGAKHLTFTKKERHHTWGLPKDKWFKAKKAYEKDGYIPLGFLT